MNIYRKRASLAGWLVVLLLLQGCAAATVIRKQPDFDREDRQQLSRVLPAAASHPVSMPVTH